VRHAVYRVALPWWGQCKEAPGRGRSAEVAWCVVGAELGRPLRRASGRSLDLLSGVEEQGKDGAWTSSPACEQAVHGGVADVRAAAATDGWVGSGGRLMLK
jgi:hypothetical protein